MSSPNNLPEIAFEDVLAPGVTIRQLDDGLFSALPEGDLGAPYDRVAAAYDRAVSMNLYLRLAWGITREDNATFIGEAFQDHDQKGSNWLVDIAAGSVGHPHDVDDRRDSRTEAAVDRDQSDTHGANNSNTAVYATSHMPLLVIR